MRLQPAWGVQGGQARRPRERAGFHVGGARPVRLRVHTRLRLGGRRWARPAGCACCGSRRMRRRWRVAISGPTIAGLRVQEALALGERDVDPRRGSLLARRGNGGCGRWIGTDARGWEQLGALVRRPRRAAARAAVLRHRRPDSGPLLVEGRVRVEFIALPPRRACGGAARRTSCATRTLSSSPANASRSPSSRANSSSAQRVVSASVRCCQPAPDRGHPEGATGEALFHVVQT